MPRAREAQSNNKGANLGFEQTLWQAADELHSNYARDHLR